MPKVETWHAMTLQTWLNYEEVRKVTSTMRTVASTMRKVTSTMMMVTLTMMVTLIMRMVANTI
jgi:hypothetical protein